jgi:hypothetical protein
MSFDPLRSLSENSWVHWDSNSFGSVGVHSLTFSYTLKSMKCDFQVHSWPTRWQALALVVSPRLGLRHVDSLDFLKFLLILLSNYIYIYIYISFESSLDYSFIWSKSMDSIEVQFSRFWTPFNVWSTYLYGFNLLTLTNTRFGSKLLIETRKTLLLGKQFYILNGPNDLFAQGVFSPLGNHIT